MGAPVLSVAATYAVHGHSRCLLTYIVRKMVLLVLLELLEPLPEKKRTVYEKISFIFFKKRFVFFRKRFVFFVNGHLSYFNNREKAKFCNYDYIHHTDTEAQSFCLHRKRLCASVVRIHRGPVAPLAPVAPVAPVARSVVFIVR